MYAFVDDVLPAGLITSLVYLGEGIVVDSGDHGSVYWIDYINDVYNKIPVSIQERINMIPVTVKYKTMIIHGFHVKYKHPRLSIVED